MQALTADIPKPMLPIGGRPLLEHIVRGLRAAGIERFAVIDGYRAEQIENHFGDGSAFGADIRYCRQERQDGTARALLLAEEAIAGRPFVLAWGDILTKRSNYPALLRAFARRDLTIGVNWVDDPCRGAAVYVDDGWNIVRIEEKPPPGTATTHWNNAGLAAAEPLLFDYARSVRVSPRGEYELPDAFTAMIADGRSVSAFPLEGDWLDVGRPEDLSRAEALVRSAG